MVDDRSTISSITGDLNGALHTNSKFWDTLDLKFKFLLG